MVPCHRTSPSSTPCRMPHDWRQVLPLAQDTSRNLIFQCPSCKQWHLFQNLMVKLGETLLFRLNLTVVDLLAIPFLESPIRSHESAELNRIRLQWHWRFPLGPWNQCNVTCIIPSQDFPSVFFLVLPILVQSPSTNLLFVFWFSFPIAIRHPSKPGCLSPWLGFSTRGCGGSSEGAFCWDLKAKLSSLISLAKAIFEIVSLITPDNVDNVDMED